jgi:asparagine synthase (glutamine-hydrolysing)
MCGIVGMVGFANGCEPAPIERMTDLLRHRGPDDVGYWRSETGKPPAALGHARLSIIDVTASRQPMSSVDGRYLLVFNGEIFNYRQLRAEVPYPYRTDGDTEVLLAGLVRQGPAFVSRLRGQFAFALYDSLEGSVLLARDRLGVLPLYVHLSDTAVLFGSEVKALLPAMATVPDTASLDAYLAYGAVPAPFTLFTGIRKVLPGHTLFIDGAGRSHSECYWSPEQSAAAPPADGLAVRHVGEALREGVRSALVADVPVGAYLSGGLDSSLVVSLMRSLQPDDDIATFCASFGSGPHDEAPYARRAAALLRTDHHQVEVRADDFLELWPELTWYRDAPISQPADIAVFRLAQAARQHVKVVLSGEGSDELFGGYPKYSMAQVTGAAGTLHPAAPFLDRLMGRTGRARIVERAALAYPRSEAVRTWFAPFPEWQRRRLLGGSRPRPLPAYPSKRGMVNAMLRHDLATWLPDNLLERGDRMSMAAGLELRPPFLDHDVVDLAQSLPHHVKVRGGRRKWVVKQVAGQYLPKEIIDRPKVGFRVPLDRWFRGDLKEMAADLLTSSNSFVANVLDRRETARLLQDHLHGRSNEERGLWTLLSLEVWHRRFFG